MSPQLQGVLVPHWLLMRDPRVEPFAAKRWVEARGDPDRFIEVSFEWITKNVSFCTDQNCFGQDEFVQMPAETLTSGYGDCDCSALSLVSVLWLRGVPSHMVFGYVGNSSHRWVEAFYKHEWWVFDTTTGGRFPASQALKRGYEKLFEVTPFSVRPSFMPVPLPLP